MVASPVRYDPTQSSVMELICSLPEDLRVKALEDWAGGGLKDEGVAKRLKHEWALWGRPKQQAPPGDWFIWLSMGGRGFGKTRTICEWARKKKDKVGRLALVGRTAADVRDVIIEGDSGILAISPPWDRPAWNPSNRRLTWPNGAKALTFSAEEPDQLRGPQFGAAACDEVAAWRYVETAMANLTYGMRAAKVPQIAMATTPRPIPYIKELVALSAEAGSGVMLTTGTTFENYGNLPQAYIDHVVKRHLGTRLGEQELLAKILGDTPGALWRRDQIIRDRVMRLPALRRIVIGVDPAASSSEQSAETGIVGVGIDNQRPAHLYAINDFTLRGLPAEWAAAVIQAYRAARADRIIAERNNGGDMVEFTIRNVDGGANLPVRLVWASRGKQTRAEPVSALYEQHRFHHLGQLGELEDEQCTWVPGEGDSPNRVDALVWAATDLIIDPEESPAPGLVKSAGAARGAAYRIRAPVVQLLKPARRVPV